jgi:PST family polysaccharide transporter
MRNDTSNFKGKALLGVVWQYGSVLAHSVLQLISITVLARLLSASDFGLMAIALIFVNLSMIVSQIGVGPALVQRPVITDSHVRSGFLLSVFLGCLLTLLLVVCSPYIASAFDDVRLEDIVQVVAFGFTFSSFGIVSEGLLIRRMNFKELTIINVGSFGFGYVVTSVILAMAGFGVWSLAFASLVQAALKSALCYRLVRHSLVPHFSIATIRELLYFGSGFTIARLFNFGATQGDNFIIGLLSTSSILGIYTRAYQLMMIPVVSLGSSVERVMFPLMSRYQGQMESMRNLYLVGNALLATVALPCSVLMIVTAEDLILSLLGKKWAEVVSPFQILAVAIVFRTAYKMGDSVAKAVGAVYIRSFRELLYLLLIVGGTYIGLRAGLRGVATAVSSAILLNYLMTVAISSMQLRLSPLTVLKTFAPGLFFSLVTILVYAAVDVAIDTNRHGLRALLAWGTSGLAAITVIMLFPHTIGRYNRSVLRFAVSQLPDSIVTRRLPSLVIRRLSI